MKRKIDEALFKWKNSHNRMPLLLNGARQVGKTYSLLSFARTHYENHVHVSLDINKRIAASLEDDISPPSVIRMLEAETHEKIVPEKTLIILDEIQASERALTSLKYFCEETPEYHVAAAGSLLGVAVNREKYSFPVGKVNSLSLYPLDLEEYLISRDEHGLLAEIKRCYDVMEPMDAALHERAADLYREYLITGGMPACVKARVEGESLIEIPFIQNDIVNNYVADMAKYATPSETVKIRACYESIPAQLAKENTKFQYKVVRKGGSAALFGASIEWLKQAGVVLKCQNTEQGTIPITAYADLSAFKLYCSDVGLLTMQTELPHSIILSGMENTFLGSVTENYVAQQLAARGVDLFYWTNEGRAELDFVVQTRNGLTALEVKRGTNSKGKSLRMFKKMYDPDTCVRLSLKNFGTTDGILALPLYALFCLEL